MTEILLKPASSLDFLLLRQTSFHMRLCATSLDRLHLDGIKLRWETNDVSSVSVPCNMTEMQRSVQISSCIVDWLSRDGISCLDSCCLCLFSIKLHLRCFLLAQMASHAGWNIRCLNQLMGHVQFCTMLRYIISWSMLQAMSSQCVPLTLSGISILVSATVAKI